MYCVAIKEHTFQNGMTALGVHEPPSNLSVDIIHYKKAFYVACYCFFRSTYALSEAHDQLVYHS